MQKMFDSIKRKLQRQSKSSLMKNSRNEFSKNGQFQLDLTRQEQQHQAAIMIELSDLSNNRPKCLCCSNKLVLKMLHPNTIIVPERNASNVNIKQLDEHVYEEITDEEKHDKHYYSLCSCDQATLFQQEIFVNELITQTKLTNMKKKSVRFNSNFGNFTLSDCSSSNKTANSANNSILKKRAEQRNSLTDDSSSSSLNSPQINTLDSKSNESSSLSSGFLGYNNNNSNNNNNSSINSGGSNASIASHSQVFNQMVEDFLNHVSAKTRASLNSSTTNIKKNSDSSYEIEANRKSSRNAFPDQRLSFRVTNLSLDDLKLRQKMIYLQNSSNKTSLPINV